MFNPCCAVSTPILKLADAPQRFSALSPGGAGLASHTRCSSSLRHAPRAPRAPRRSSPQQSSGLVTVRAATGSDPTPRHPGALRAKFRQYKRLIKLRKSKASNGTGLIISRVLTLAGGAWIYSSRAGYRRAMDGFPQGNDPVLLKELAEPNITRSQRAVCKHHKKNHGENFIKRIFMF